MSSLGRVVQPENQTKPGGSNERSKNGLRPYGVTDCQVETLVLEECRHLSPRPPDGPGPADSHFSQGMWRHANLSELGAQSSFETQGEVGDHFRAQLSLSRQGYQKRLNPPKKVAGVNVKNSHDGHADFRNGIGSERSIFRECPPRPNQRAKE